MKYESLIKLSYQNNDEYKSKYQNRINNECATFLDFSISTNEAFYLTNPEMLLLITLIMDLDKDLTRKTKYLPENALKQFTVQALIDEIKQTNDIENVYSTKKEIRETYKRIEKGLDKGRFKGLVSKYDKFKTNEEIKLEDCQDIRTLYNELVLDEVVEEDKDNAPDGLFFRKDIVNVHAQTGKIIHTGLYPEDKIINAMTKALKVLNDVTINPLVSAAIFHYMFAYIHPFYDGNGRTDRFISSYVISKSLNPLVAYKFSYIVKKHQKQYYEMFSDTNDPRNKGDLTPFIIQFLEFIFEVETELIKEIDKKIYDLNYFRIMLLKLDLGELESDVAEALLENALFDEEGLSKTRISEITGKSYNTITKALDNIESVNSKVLRTEKSGNRKLYDLDLNVLAEL